MLFRTTVYMSARFAINQIAAATVFLFRSLKGVVVLDACDVGVAREYTCEPKNNGRVGGRKAKKY